MNSSTCSACHLAFVSGVPLAARFPNPLLSAPDVTPARSRPPSRPLYLVSPRMSIQTDVSKRLTEAMKAKDSDKTRALRLIRAAFLTKLKEDGGSSELSDDAAVAVLRKLAKMRRESIDMFGKGGRDDLVASEKADLEIVEGYLPQLADEETTEIWAKEAIEAAGVTDKSQSGKAIGFLMKKHRADVDGKLAKDIVLKLLS